MTAKQARMVKARKAVRRFRRRIIDEVRRKWEALTLNQIRADLDAMPAFTPSPEKKARGGVP